MKIFGLSLSIIGLIAFFYFLISFVKSRNPDDKKINKSFLIKSIASASVFGIGFSLLIGGFAIDGEWGMDVLHGILTYGGCFLFTLSLLSLIWSFAIHYYKLNLENDLTKKWIYRLIFISIPLILVFFVVFAEGFAPYIIYPLNNSIVFGGEEGIISFMRSGEFAAKGVRVAFYGIVIVSGAIVVYFICDHKFYQVYGRHGILDTCFLIAFPSGIIGARLWYCLVLRPDYYFSKPLEILNIAQGGLAIMGGAVLGIIAGVTYMLCARKYVNIRKAMDIIVPCILIAQAIGRWGNFFNQEVYGNIVNKADWWFIPTFIKNQMSICFEQGSVLGTLRIENPSIQMHVPLFLIEGISNLTGYFAIVYGVGKPLKKYLALGDKAGMYLMWYGATRAIMEPLRYGESGAVDKFDQSWYSSFVLIGAGILLIVLFHVYELIMKKRFNKDFKEEKECIL